MRYGPQHRALRALLLCLVFILQACASRPVADDELHFMLWREHQPGPLERAILAFEEANPGVRVVAHRASENASDYYREVTTKLRNQDPALDVFFLDVVWPAEFAARGYMEPLEDRVSQAEREQFLAATIEANTVDGRLYAMPFNVDVGILYYRRDLLEKYGFAPPRTWEALVGQVDVILAGEQRPGLYGYAAQFDRYEGLVCNVLEFVEARSGSLVDANGRVLVDTPETAEALRWIRDQLIHNTDAPNRASDYLLTAKEQESRQLFLRGDAIFLREWPEVWTIAADPEASAVHDRVAMASLPAFEGGAPAAALGGWQIAIASHSDRKDLAWRFIEHMTSHETQAQLAIERSQAMARVTVYQDSAVLRAMPHLGLPGSWGAPLGAAAAAAAARPRSPRYNALSERMQRCFHEAIRLPGSDIPALLEACQVQLDQVDPL